MGGVYVLSAVRGVGLGEHPSRALQQQPVHVFFDVQLGHVSQHSLLRDAVLRGEQPAGHHDLTGGGGVFASTLQPRRRWAAMSRSRLLCTGTEE